MKTLTSMLVAALMVLFSATSFASDLSTGYTVDNPVYFSAVLTVDSPAVPAKAGMASGPASGSDWLTAMAPGSNKDTTSPCSNIDWLIITKGMAMACKTAKEPVEKPIKIPIAI